MKINYLLIYLIVLLYSCSQQKEVVLEKYPSGKKKVTQLILSVTNGDTLKRNSGFEENGVLSFTEFLRNNKRDSSYTLLNIDGNGGHQIDNRTFYVNGKKNGLSTGWYHNGQKKYEVNYINDLKSGTETTWYENGNKQSEGSYEDGKNIELWTYWYENGNKKEEGSYKGGEFEKLSPLNNKSTPDFIPLKHGKWSYWNEKGELIKTEYWQQGNLKDQ